MRHWINIAEAMSRLSNPDFRKWFAGSKIVDRSGKPLVCYHGTPTHGHYSNNKYVRSEQAGYKYPEFTEFDTSLGGITDSGWLGQGSYFTPDPDYAYEFGNFIIPCYLSIKNPFIILDDSSSGTHNTFRFLMSLQNLKGLPEKFKLDLSLPEPRSHYSVYDHKDITIKYALSNRGGKSNHWYLLSGTNADDGVGVVESEGETPEEAIFAYRYRFDDRYNGFLLHIIKKIGADVFSDMLKANGFDGVVEYRDMDGDHRRIQEVVAFYPNQIKSIHNSGSFDTENPNFMH